ncbi:MAG: hypothetical protein AAB443_00675 [Patescibacteria group bacterium]
MSQDKLHDEEEVTLVEVVHVSSQDLELSLPEKLLYPPFALLLVAIILFAFAVAGGTWAGTIIFFLVLVPLYLLHWAVQKFKEKLHIK